MVFGSRCGVQAYRLSANIFKNMHRGFRMKTLTNQFAQFMRKCCQEAYGTLMLNSDPLGLIDIGPCSIGVFRKNSGSSAQ